MRIVIDIIIGFCVGVLSNLATHFLIKLIKAEAGGESPHRRIISLKAWFEAFVWGILPMIYPLTALFLLQHRWPLTLLGKAIMMIISFIIAMGIVVVMRYISLHQSTRQILVVLLVAGLLGGLSGFYLLDQILPTFISMDCPDQVKGMTTLKGRIIDPRWHIYVILRPRQGGAFVNEAPHAGKDGAWYITCTFGGGSGSVFDVLALALSPDSVKALDIQLIKKPNEYQKRLEDLATYKTSICVVTKE